VTKERTNTLTFTALVGMAGSALLTLLLLFGSTAPGRGTQSDEGSQQSLKRYFGERNAGDAVRDAVRIGHIVPGMTREQVVAALGEPIRTTHSSRTPAMEHWLYPMERLHQEDLRGRGWSAVRITFIDGRVVRLEGR
jgi:hypothetical protein